MPIKNSDDTLIKQVAEVKRKRKLQKQKRYSGSVIRPYFTEIQTMITQLDCTYSEVQLWLKDYKRVKISVAGIKNAYRRIREEMIEDESHSKGGVLIEQENSNDTE